MSEQPIRQDATMLEDDNVLEFRRSNLERDIAPVASPEISQSESEQALGYITGVGATLDWVRDDVMQDAAA